MSIGITEESEVAITVYAAREQRTINMETAPTESLEGRSGSA